jgi:uncharacterized phiE125 gp8 family phage protein
MLISTNSTRTEPTLEPVSVAELQSHCRIDDPENHTELEGMIKAARQAIETAHIWRALINQTCVDKFDAFGDLMGLRWPTVQSITSITYVDVDGATQTLSTDIYELAAIDGIGVVRLKYGQEWPSLYDHEDVVTVTYVAGYGTSPDDVPMPIRQAILIYANWLYVAREGEDGPFGTLDSLLEPYSAWRVM